MNCAKRASVVTSGSAACAAGDSVRRVFTVLAETEPVADSDAGSAHAEGALALDEATGVEAIEAMIPMQEEALIAPLESSTDELSAATLVESGVAVAGVRTAATSASATTEGVAVGTPASTRGSTSELPFD